MKQSERSFQFMQNFITLHNQGSTVHDVADFYNLSYAHAYRLVRKLAEKLGVPYETLLERPHGEHIMIGSGKNIEPVKRVDFSNFEKEYREGLSAIDKTLYQMDKVLNNWPKTPEKLI